MKLGSGDNGEFTFLDTIALLSFLIGVENLEENLTQSDKQDLADRLDKEMDLVLREIHQHLEKQDETLNKILEVLKHDM